MDLIQKVLAAHDLLILDGAMATELERRGADIKDALWSAKVLIENPAAIEGVHYDYFVAGADCAMTASYQATIEGFIKRGCSPEQARQLIRDSVTLAQKARERFLTDHSLSPSRPQPLIVAAIGPYGAYLADGSEYRGNYQMSEAQLVDFHRERAALLLDAGADILAFETIPSLLEAKAIVHLMEEFPNACYWISFSCNSGDTICEGTPIGECAKFLDGCGQLGAIGINCTPPDFVPSLISKVRAESGKPIAVYPNSGEEYAPVTKTWRGCASAEDFAARAKEWRACGARIIGGCCRTTPEDIAAVARWARGEGN